MKIESWRLDFTEALLQSRTVVIVFLIVLAMLIAFVAANEIAERVRSSMAWYRLHELASRLNANREARKCEKRMNAYLRSKGCVEAASGKWQKPIEPGVASQSATSLASAPNPIPGPGADAFIREASS